MKKLTLLFLVATITFSSCIVIEPKPAEVIDSVVTQSFNVNKFDNLKLSMNYNAKVTLKQSDKPMVLITAPRSVVDDIDVTSSNGILEVTDFFSNNGTATSENLSIIVEFAELSKIENLGISDIYQEGELSFKELYITNGRGNITLNNIIVDKNLTVLVSNSGNVNISELQIGNEIKNEIKGPGDINMHIKKSTKRVIENKIIFNSGDINVSSDTTYKKNTVQIIGSGNVYSDKLPAQEVIVSSRDKGEAYVYAIDKLDVEITGRGNVYYIGNPEIKSNIHGLGELINNN